MADFEQVLSRAIAGLSDKSAEHRRALYDRARTSLVAQLKVLEPPLPQTEIAKQRLALEHAIRKVEGQLTLQDITQRDQLRREEFNAKPVARPSMAPRPAAPEVKASVIAKTQPPAPIEVVPPAVVQDPTEREAIAPEEQQVQPVPAEEETVDEVVTSEEMPYVQAEEAPVVTAHSMPEDEQDIAALRHIFHRIEDIPADEVPAEYSTESHKAPFHHGVSGKLKALKHLFTVPDLPPSALDNLDEPEQPVQSVKPPRFGRGSMNLSQRRTMIVAALVLASFAGAWVIIMSSDMIGRVFSSVPRSVIGLVEGEGEGRRKATERLDAEFEGPAAQSAQVSENEEIIPVAQTAILYEENPAVQQQGEAFKGQILWKVESEVGADGKPEKFMRGVLEIPQRKMKLTISLRRNLDVSLPASHTVELLFDLPPDFVQKGISSVPGVLMKPAEQARGVPLVGASARITNSYFLIGLSNLAADKDRNILMLKDRSWLEIPILYETRLRAVLVMDKGTSGERMFRQVFASWKQ